MERLGLGMLGAILWLWSLGIDAALAASPPTVVHEYVPPVPMGQPKSGDCFATSIASNRPTAYRCMVQNAIYDPCFLTSRPQALVCDANPAQDRRGFPLHAQKPLPAEQHPTGPVLPFLVRLRDGTVCAPETGTRALVGKTIVAYDCAASKGQSSSTYVGLADPLEMKTSIWRAHRVVYKAGSKGPELVSLSAVEVAAVWR